MSSSVPRTATFAWSRSSRASPLLATGTVSGALDESFSSTGALELWEPFGDEQGEGAAKGRVNVNARFNRLAWSAPSDSRPEGVIAAGMENGEVGLWDPVKILAGQGEQASIFNTDRHKGTVRGLAWNTLQPSLFASGATDAEIFIWDTKNLTKPYGPSANKSRHLTDITALAWNPSVAHILATASASGSTVVWDLKGRQEVIHLSYLGGQGSVYSQGPKPVSSVCWHAERGTRVITASEDDGAPVILVWDLRNYRTPERVLSGHEKGILSLDWCKQDPDLLFSCGKDCRTLAWNPSTGECVGELPATTNWSFDVASCPRNPSFVATASFDGKINITSLQSTGASSEPAVQQETRGDTAADIFSAGNLSNLAAQVHPGVSLKQPPRWLRRPNSSSFGFGGKLATVTSSRSTPESVQQLVRVHQVVTESDVVERAVKLDNAKDTKQLADFVEEKRSAASTSAPEAQGGMTNWNLLSSLFNADSKDELVTLLGFSKEDVKRNVEEAIKSFKSGAGSRKGASSDSGDVDDAGSVAREPLVTFADQSSVANDAMSGSSEGEGAAAAQQGDKASLARAPSEPTPSETEASVSAVSDATTKIGGAESEITEPSLFGDDAGPGIAQQQAAADFYSQLGGSGTPSSSARPPPTLSERFNLTQHHSDRAGSSVAATIGSRPSSAASDHDLKQTTFRIYPQDESEADRLLTRALVLGDFESAVSLCLSADRFADALLLAGRGGPELLARTQKAYFDRRTVGLPYLRLFQSIVSFDLTDVVQHADLSDWQEIFVVLCTFAKSEEFASLTEQLGQRLEYQSAVAAATPLSKARSSVEHRRSAVLCYLAAGKLDKVVSIWIEEMREQEAAIEQSLSGSGEGASSASASVRFAAHAEALQTFIEKVTVFISAVAYVDTDLSQPAGGSSSALGQQYRLSALYDKYHEYAELLASQGLVTLAAKYAALTPADYVAPGDGVSARERLQAVTGMKIQAPSVAQQLQQAVAAKAPFANSAVASQYQQQPSSSSSSFYGAQQQAPHPYSAGNQMPYQQPGNQQQQQQSQTQQPAYDDPYAPTPSQMPPQQPGLYGQQAPVNAYGPPSNYPSANGYPVATSGGSNGYNPSSFVPQPPALITSSPNFTNQQAQQSAPVPPPPIKKQVGGWNDAPAVAPKRTGSAAGNRPAVAPILSPFPNASPSGGPGMYGGSQYGQQQQHPGVGGPSSGAAVPPPPPPSRGQTKTPAQQFVAPPPPRGGSAMQQQHHNQQYSLSPSQHSANLPPPQPRQSGPFIPPPPQQGHQQGGMGRAGPPPQAQQQPQQHLSQQGAPTSNPQHFQAQQGGPMMMMGPGGQGMPPQQRFGGPPPPPAIQQQQPRSFGPPQAGGQQQQHGHPGSQQPQPPTSQPAFVPPPPARRG